VRHEVDQEQKKVVYEEQKIEPVNVQVKQDCAKEVGYVLIKRKKRKKGQRRWIGPFEVIRSS
jgi:hypothetical protein